MNNSSVLSKLKNLSEFLIMKGGKKNTSKLIKVKRPYRTKSGKVAYRDTWVLPNQVKPDEKIHNEHKLHHKLPKEHPDYKKKEMHPNFEAGREKHLEKRRNKEAEDSNKEPVKKPNATKKTAKKPKIKDEPKKESTKSEKTKKPMKQFSVEEVQRRFHEFNGYPKSQKTQKKFDDVRREHFNKIGGTQEEWSGYISGKLVPSKDHPIIPKMAEAMSHLHQDMQKNVRIK